MVLLCAGEEGRTLVKLLKKNLRRTLPSNIQTEILYNSTKFSSLRNNSKDVTVKEKYDVVERSVCSMFIVSKIGIIIELLVLVS